MSEAEATPDVLVGEHRLVIRELIVGGKLRMECTIEGDGMRLAEENPEAPVSMAYLTVATAFEMFNDGTLFQQMHRIFGTAPSSVKLSLETIDPQELRVS